jgi:peptidoglycan/xylan/chitin deacetylase (PgdA/CDA1 family)
VFIHGSRRSDDVALSFDVCPTSQRPGFSPDIVDTLTRAQAPATFFVSGRWAEAHPDALRQLAAVPFFEVALHGHRHRSLRGAGRNAIVAEIEDGRRAIERLGVTPGALFRPPFGDRPPELAAAARGTAVVPVLWDVVSGDPDPALPPATLARNVLRQARGGSIIVMHANGRGIASAAALPELIVALRARGLIIHAHLLRMTNGLKQAESLANQSLVLARSLSDRYMEAYSLWGLGSILTLQGNLEQGIPIVEQSLAIYRSIGDPLGQAIAARWLSLKTNDSGHSKSLLLESLRLSREMGNLSGIGV